MRKRLYPMDQIDHYLLIDVIALISLFYHVVTLESVLGLTGQLLLFAIFLTAFYIGLWHRDWRLLFSCCLGCAALAVIAGLKGSWLLLYGGIFADFLGRSKSKRHMAFGMAAILLMFMAVSSWSYGHPFAFFKTILLPVLMIELALPLVIYAKEQSKQLKEELKEANKRLIQEQERQRLARDLHDTLGQTLTMIKLKSELTARMLEKDSGRAKKELIDIRDSSRTALKQVRELVDTMMSVSLAEELAYASKALHAAGVRMNIEGKASDLSISHAAETMMALSLREAVTNVMKHSRADNCLLTFSQAGGCAVIRVEDNGIGLVKTLKGTGLASMRERMKAAGGEANVTEGMDGGVTVTLKVPVLKERKEDR